MLGIPHKIVPRGTGEEMVDWIDKSKHAKVCRELYLKVALRAFMDFEEAWDKAAEQEANEENTMELLRKMAEIRSTSLSVVNDIKALAQS